MAASEFKQLLSKLSPGNKVQWACNSFYDRWVKLCARNAPAKKKALGEREVGIDVHQSDTEGAELSVDVDAIKEKLEFDYIDAQICIAGVVVTERFVVQEIPEGEEEA